MRENNPGNSTEDQMTKGLKYKNAHCGMETKGLLCPSPEHVQGAVQDVCWMGEELAHYFFHLDPYQEMILPHQGI